MSAIRPKAGTTMILAGVPIIVAVAFSLTAHEARSADATEVSGHHAAVADLNGVAIPAGGDDQSASTTSLVALSTDPDWNRREHDKTKKPTETKTVKPTQTKTVKPTQTKTVKPTQTKTTAPPTTKPPVTVQPTRTELPVTGGGEVSLAVAAGGLVLIGALMLLLRRMARDT